MSEHFAAEIGSLEEELGSTIHVGIDHGHVAIYLNGWLSADGISLSAAQVGELVELIVSAVWQAGRQAQRMADEVSDA